MKKFISLLVSTCMILSVLPMGTTAFAATKEGVPGEVIIGDYVAIVNTNVDTTKKQSTGTITFDESGGTVKGTLRSSRETMISDGAEFSNLEPSKDTVFQQKKGRSTATTYAIGDEKTLYQSVTFVCIGIGANCYIWMEKGMKAEYEAANKVAKAAAEMIFVYEGEPYQTLNAMCQGRIPYADNSGKLSILLEDTKGSSSGYYAGEAGITAIHIDTPIASKYTGGQFAGKNGLLVHECQHALFRHLVCGGDGNTAYQYSWINEGLAVASMDYTWGGADPNGWMTFINDDAGIRNGSPLVYQAYRNSTSLDYGLQYAFVRYLSNRLAGGKYDPLPFFNAVYKTPINGKKPNEYINSLIKTYDSTSTLTFEKVLSDFYVAMVAHEPTGEYGFGNDPIPSEKINNYPIYMGKSGESIDVTGTGAIVIKTKDGQFTVPNDAGSDMRFIAFNKGIKPSPADGNGTSQNPYLIKKPADLNFLSSHSSSHFKLVNDIDMSANTSFFFTVGRFSGVLDGNGNTISNLDQPLTSNNVRGTIKNLNVSVKFTDEYQAFTGILSGLNQGLIRACSVSGTVNSRLFGGNFTVPNTFGGIAGCNDMSGTITECKSDVTMQLNISTNHGRIGGLVGENVGIIDNSFATGSIDVTQDDTQYELFVGGAVGSVQSTMFPGPYVENIYSTANIKIVSGAAKQSSGRLFGNVQSRVSSTLNSVYALDGMSATGNGTAEQNSAMSKTSDEMKELATYVGWNFDGIWKMPSSGTPIFKTNGDIGAITVKINLNKYFVGEKINLYRSKLQIGSSSVDLTEDMLTTALDSSTTGSKTITGNYKGQSFNFQVTVVEPATVAGLKVYQAAKSTYVEGDVFTDDGVVLLGTLDGQTNRYIYTGYTHDKHSPLTTADTNVTYTYCGQPVSQPLTVTPVTISALRLISPMKKIIYQEGETISFAGLLYQIQYSNGVFSPLLDESTFSANNITFTLGTNQSLGTAFNPSTKFTISDNGKVLYAKVGGTEKSMGICVLTIKPNMKLDDETFISAIGTEEYHYSKSITGGSGNYTTTLKPDTTYDKTVIENISLPGKFGSNNFQFTVKAKKAETIILPYIITDTVTGASITVNITFVNTAPSSACDLLKVDISKGFGGDNYSGKINNTTKTVDFTIPNGTDKSVLVYNNPVLSKKATSSPVNGQNVFNSGTAHPFVVTAQDRTSKNTYTINVTEAQAGATALAAPTGLIWDGTKAKWDAVPNASGYLVFLHTWDSSASPAQPSIDAVSYTVDSAKLEYDFSKDLNKNDVFVFRVITLGNATTTLNSTATISSPKDYALPPSVTQITLSPSSASVSRGNTKKFDAIVIGVSNPDKTVKWELKNAINPSTSISQDGLLTIGSDESASSITVVAKSVQTPSITAQAIVTITDIPKLATPQNVTWDWASGSTVTKAIAKWDTVSGASGYKVTLLKDNAPLGTPITLSSGTFSYDFKGSITVGGSYTFKVEATGDGINNQTSTAAVSQPGIFTPITVTSVTITPTSATILKGQQKQFSASVIGTNSPSQKVTWKVTGATSSSTSISQDGLLTIGSNENASSITVVATSEQNTSITAQAIVTVNDIPKLATPQNVTWDWASGNTVTKAIAKWDAVSDASGYKVTLLKDNAPLGTPVTLSSGTFSYDFKGSITVGGSYTFKVEATGDGINYQTSTAAVSQPGLFAPITVTSVNIDPTSAILSKGDEKQFSASVIGTNNPSQEVMWELTGAGSPDTTLTTTGLLKVSASESQTKLTVKATSVANPLIFKTVDVRVIVPTIVSVSIMPKTPIIIVGGSMYTFTVQVMSTDSPPITVNWGISGAKSSNTQIDSYGKLTVATNETSTKLTVTATSTYDNSKSDAVTVTVVPLPKAVIDIKDSISKLPAPENVQSSNALDISAAKDQYDKLIAEEKALLTLTEIKKLSDTILSLPHIKTSTLWDGKESNDIKLENLGLIISPAEIRSNDNIIITLDCKVTPTSSDEKLFTALAVERNLKVGEFYNITLQKQVGTNASINVTDTENIKIVMAIPSAIQGKTGYTVMRVHGGTAELLPTTVSGNDIVFFTGKFSNYAIAYDKEIGFQWPEIGGGNIPNTGYPLRNVCNSILILSGALAGTLYLFINLKKTNRKTLRRNK